MEGGGQRVKGRYVLAIDGGSQSTKLTVFDLEGRAVCAAGVPLRPASMPAPGVVEHPGDDLWDTLVKACARLWEKFDGGPEDIAAVGLCSIRYCRCLLQKDGRLASPVISWMDERVARPYEHTDPRVAYVVSANGYLTKRLTGENRDTVSNYQGQWPIDTDAWAWSADEAVIKRYGIPREMLFGLCMPGEVLGHITKEAAGATGLPAGAPVVATGNDKAVEALGCGLVDGGALLSLGTYICAMAPGDANRASEAFWSNFACVPHGYLWECGGIRRGMWLVSWQKELFGRTEKQLDALAETAPPGSDGLLVVPEWLAKPDRPYQRGVMLGFDARHGAAHIFRATLEGIAMTMKNNFDAMARELSLAPQSLTVSGGGSHSGLFMQIIADVFGLPAARCESGDAVGLGGAICAAVALGAYPGFVEAARAMVRRRDSFAPRPNVSRFYSEINEGVYAGLTQSTDVPLKKAYPIFHKETNGEAPV